MPDEQRPQFTEDELKAMHDRISALAAEMRAAGAEALAVALYAVACYMAAGQLHKLLDAQSFSLTILAMYFEHSLPPEHQAVRDFDVLTRRREDSEALYATNKADPTAAGVRPVEAAVAAATGEGSHAAAVVDEGGVDNEWPDVIGE